MINAQDTGVIAFDLACLIAGQERAVIVAA